jgi:hypothetical protein
MIWIRSTPFGDLGPNVMEKSTISSVVERRPKPKEWIVRNAIEASIPLIVSL